MIEIHEILDLTTFMELVPLFREGFQEMNRNKKVFSVDEEGFLNTLIGILNTCEKNGILVAYDDGKPIGFGAGYECTPAFCKERHLLLWALYAQRSSSGSASKMLFQAAEFWAKARGYHKLIAYNHRFSGAALKLFRDRFGMFQKQIRFEKDL